MAFERRSTSGDAPDSTLSAGINDTDLSFTAADLTGWPDGTGGKFTVIFDPDTDTEEHALASARSGNTVTFSDISDRGIDDSSPVAHSASAVVRHGLTKRDVDEANDAVSQTIGQIAAKGDLLVGSAANTLTKLGIGSAGQALVVSGGTLAYGKPTLAESDITDLVNDLAGKLAVPATDFAVGSIPVGTGTNTYDTLPVGADGTVLTADSTASDGVAWKTNPALAPLAHVDYTSTTGSLHVTTSGSPVLTVVDGTNLSPSFTVPSSGKALIRVSGALNHNSSVSDIIGIGWLNHTGGTQVGRTQTDQAPGISSSIGYTKRFTCAQTLTGLSAGATLQLDLAIGTVNSSSNTMTLTDVTIEVWSVS